MIRQCVILCGGLGTRLGALTGSTPKPLLAVGGRPFLDILLGELGRQKYRRVLLLAGFAADKIHAFARQSEAARRFGIEIGIAVEPEPAGTGGAIWQARDSLDESFLLLNGDSWFDFPLRRLDCLLAAAPRATGAIALRGLPDASRYGAVDVEDGDIRGFAARADRAGSGVVNAGVYAFRRDPLLGRLTPGCSLEADTLPGLAEQGLLRGEESAGFFIDIGVPESYRAAQKEVPDRLRRPALFLDRDGVLNVDHGHVGSTDRFEWIEGARAAVADANRAGYYVFLVTNQAGIGRGRYSEADFRALLAHMDEDLAAAGAHLDDVRWCPHHPEAAREEYRQACGWRKPEAGMLLDLMRNWPVIAERSFMVGDQPTDVEAARRAGLAGYRFEGGDLFEFLRRETPLGAARRDPDAVR